ISTLADNAPFPINSARPSHLVTDRNVSEGTDAGDVLYVEGTVAVSGTTTLNAATIHLDANITGAVTGSTATVVNVNRNLGNFPQSPNLTPVPPLNAQIQDGINVAASGATVTVAANNGGLDQT